MNRQLTNLEGLLTLTLLALGVCLTLACTGCATPRISPVQYEVKAFSIVVGPASYIQDMWEAKTLGDHRDVGGFFDYETRTAYVDVNIWKTDQPDFAFFGHEVWHLPELGGRFHK